MKTKSFFLLIILLIIGFQQSALADRPVEWGEVPDEQWAIESFEDDDESTAIILVDYAEAYLDRSLDALTRYHIRIKIIDPNDSPYTERSIRIYRKNQYERLQKLKAQTLNQAPDGSVIATEIGRRDFQSERDGNYETTTFAFPDVRPGSIVEFSYTI